MVYMKKYLSWVYGVDRKNPSLGITVRHHEASLVMPNSDPRDRFFNPHDTPTKATYNPGWVSIWRQEIPNFIFTDLQVFHLLFKAQV